MPLKIFLKRQIFVIMNFLVIAVPTIVYLLTSVLGVLQEPDLTGTTAVPDRPAFSVRGVMDGSYQAGMDTWFNFALPGRKGSTRVYNQFLYSMLYSTDNKNIVIGKDDYLYGTAYIHAYLTETDQQEMDKLREKVMLLQNLQQKLAQRGKDFMVLITPSKASIYPEFLPSAYDPYVKMKAAGQYKQNNYEIFIDLADEAGINFFDHHAQWLDAKSHGERVFPIYGTHWTETAALAYINQAFAEINRRFERNIGTVYLESQEEVYGKAFSTDADLLNLLNLAPEHLINNFEAFSTQITTNARATDDCPSAFLMGGSFNWNWLSSALNYDADSSPVLSQLYFSYYNSYINAYPGGLFADKTDDFALVMAQDMVLIELNEQSITSSTSHFVFAQNLLDYLNQEEEGAA